MWLWYLIGACDLIIPFAMIIGGYMMWKHAPKTIEGVRGYRTPRSKKNMDTWNFAHDYCGRLWWKSGWAIILLTIAIYLSVHGASDDTIGLVGSILLATQIVVLIISVYLTEKALKKTFTNDGSRRRDL